MTKAIDFSEALQRLTDAHQIVETAILNVQDEWHPEVPPITITMTKVARALVAKAETFSPLEVEHIFGVIELLMRSGDDSIRNAVATGLLESILAYASKGELAFHRFSKHLGAESKSYCREWDKFTGVTTLGLD